MDDFTDRIKFIVNDAVFLKDPETTETGKKIIEHGILLINEMGFESFNFRKLARRIACTEGTIYRYFENKHKLLIYLLSWYWNWIEYTFVFRTNSISSDQEKLKIAIEIIADPITKVDPTFGHINEILLHEIVISESAKAYLTKEVEKDHRDGYFSAYTSLSNRLLKLIKSINPNYPFAASLSSTIIEVAHQQKFFARYLPALSDAKGTDNKLILNFLTDMVFKAITPKAMISAG